MEYVGIDLHTKESQICPLMETGEVMERRRRTESPTCLMAFGIRPNEG